ncbi:hypothetical protein MLD38_015660 [Melastoma candidum]|uniref:Uncharacterized protein n=1 Tax=Melastoma candidum TaxID=119954 RepID=A0ACB9RGM8_9MYRT|nr:hypothetical protein MLD38_015660 [Melastoma candidum]
MAATKSSVFLRVAALAVLIASMVQMQLVEQVRGQSCPSQLTNLNMCAPFVVPGASAMTPSNDCCSALQSIQHDCLCNTLRIASRLPALCQLPPLTCGQSV